LSTLLIFTALISAFHSWRKGELIGRQTSVQSIQNLSWKEFEYLVSEAYRRQGFQVTENYRSGPDGGVDLTLSKGTDKILVQCKNWKLNKVGVQVILELFGIVTSERATKGVVVCSNSFTKEATEFATRNNIELITGSALRKMVASVQDTPKIESSSKRSDCPVCGSHMIYRVAKKGSKTGKGFLGCSRFPACRGTRNQQI
jgi:restriction system protein